ncbi:uncharacterized protein BP01DRAFT_175210 [Aspergillus saccharolyticus JOP 1030-1]|uniref:Rhodopsin domain-containing protein n=1 Tax=Aspergillus saccharolyticus JOP 1030-1 TaxID=1450539 RepID=A0A318ZUK3_9EURO|nr:hypothetical protein BP01DRAFT_175210 [Aspergillus saccharolyticus JOP 1030-1]PYH48023.1 hypothetical protein BP01DRAFT_175210 [Aspergillus saccharolyticus JOP 1030-1]
MPHAAYVISDTDRRGLMVVVTTLFMSWMVLVSFFRIYMRMTIIGPWGLDDLMANVASILGIVNVGVLVKGVNDGLGSTEKQLNSSRIERAEQALYGANILFLAGHCAAKLSVLFLLRRLGRERTYLRACLGVMVGIVLWAIVSILIVALKCPFRHPWLLEQCASLLPRWQAITVLDVITELLLLGLSLYLVWPIKLTRMRKAGVIGAFGTRLGIVILAILRQTSMTAIAHTNDLLLDISDAVILTQVLLHCSIMAATLPCLKPFVVSFNTGWGQGTVGQDGSSYFHQASTASAAAQRSRASSGKRGSEIRRKDQDATRSEDAGRGNSQEWIIQETREWSLRYETIEMKPVEPK